ncbi:MAG: hypothetical protein ACE5H9_21835, partial [Anaerolineae bacterium]
MYAIQGWFNGTSVSQTYYGWSDASLGAGSLKMARQGTLWTLSYKRSGEPTFTPLLSQDETGLGLNFGDCTLRLRTYQWYADPAEPQKNFAASFDNVVVAKNEGQSGWNYAGSGTWRTEVDGGAAQVVWQTLRWEAGVLPGGTSVLFKARACSGAG